MDSLSTFGRLTVLADANVASFRTVTFVVEEKPHNRFERVDDDLVVKLNITLSQALLGPDGGGAITKEVEQLDGRRIQVSLPEGVSSGYFRSCLPILTLSSKSSNLDKKRVSKARVCQSQRPVQ